MPRHLLCLFTDRSCAVPCSQHRTFDVARLQILEQHCTMKIISVTVLNWKRIGFNVVFGVQCNILLNCAETTGSKACGEL